MKNNNKGFNKLHWKKDKNYFKIHLNAKKTNSFH